MPVVSSKTVAVEVFFRRGSMSAGQLEMMSRLSVEEMSVPTHSAEST